MTRRLAAHPGAVLALGGAIALAALACAEDGQPEYGAQDTCQKPQGALLGCPPPSGAAVEPFDEAAACMRLVRCGAIALEHRNDKDEHNNDYTACLNTLARYPADRLVVTLRCTQAATCADLALGVGSPCFKFGAKP